MVSGEVGWRARARRAVACMGSVAILGCQEVTATRVVNDAPLLYVVISADSLPSAAKGLSALLLTAGAPNASPYRTAETFLMHRASDGAVFRWTSLPKSGMSPADFAGLATPDTTFNLLLPTVGSDGYLGAGDLRPGDRLSLAIVTEGVSLNGGTTVVGRIVLRATSTADGSLVSWAPVQAAAGYAVSVDGGIIGRIQPETSVVVTRTLSGGLPEQITVVALDSNLVRYLRDAATRRAGIDGGYGVFGSTSQASMRLPGGP